MYSNKSKALNNEEKIMGYLPVYLIVDMFLKWIAMYTGIRNGVISAIILAAYTFCIFVHRNFRIKVDGSITKAIVAYIIYNFCLAIVSYMKGYTISLLLSEASNTIAPMIVFFIAKNLSNNQSNTFERTELIVATVLLVSGLYYNVTMNDPYYISFLRQSNNNFDLSWFSAAPRLTSFYGSVVCGNIGCVVAIISFLNIEKENRKQFWIPYLIGALLALLTLQRSAMVAVLLMSLVLVIHFLRIRKLKIRFIVIAVVVISLVIIILQSRYPVMFEALIARFGQVNRAVSERNQGWENAFSNGLFATIFGYGFGTGGQRAIGISLTTVNDGNYYKIIYDVGIVGLFIFGILVYNLLKKGITEKKIVYVAVILCFLFQMIGSNLLTFGSTALLFWYAAGRIARNTNDEREELL